MNIFGSQFLLRPLEKSDKESLAKSANNRNIWLNLTHLLPYPYTEKDAVEFINFVRKQSVLYNFTIDVGGNAVGMISCIPEEGVFCGNGELGYWLAEEHWGKGIVSEAIALICSYAFTELDLHRITAQVFAYNKASIHLLKKNGFEQEGILRKAIIKDHKITDLHIFGKLKDEDY